MERQQFDISKMALFTGVQHLCAFNIVAPLFITVCQMFERRRSPSAHSSPFMFRTPRPIARISSSLVLYRVPRNGFHFGEEIVIVWTHNWPRPRWSSGYQLSYSPRDPRFAGSIPAGVDVFFSLCKNPEYDFLRMGSKAVGPVS